MVATIVRTEVGARLLINGLGAGEVRRDPMWSREKWLLELRELVFKAAKAYKAVEIGWEGFKVWTKV